MSLPTVRAASASPSIAIDRGMPSQERSAAGDVEDLPDRGSDEPRRRGDRKEEERPAKNVRRTCVRPPDGRRYEDHHAGEDQREYRSGRAKHDGGGISDEA